MKTNDGPRLVIVLGVLTGFLFTAAPAHANLKETKKYKEAFPDAKPKCINCHMDEKPKKDDGQHDPNDYGKAVIKAASEPTVDTYKQVGKIEDFKKKER